MEPSKMTIFYSFYNKNAFKMKNKSPYFWY